MGAGVFSHGVSLGVKAPLTHTVGEAIGSSQAGKLLELAKDLEAPAFSIPVGGLSGVGKSSPAAIDAHRGVRFLSHENDPIGNFRPELLWQKPHFPSDVRLGAESLGIQNRMPSSIAGFTPVTDDQVAQIRKLAEKLDLEGRGILQGKTGPLTQRVSDAIDPAQAEKLGALRSQLYADETMRYALPYTSSATSAAKYGALSLGDEVASSQARAGYGLLGVHATPEARVATPTVARFTSDKFPAYAPITDEVRAMLATPRPSAT